MTQVDWDAETYHRLSEPQRRWGLEVLEELELRGDETVLDAGCGTGRLTAALLERLPAGRVIALDASPAMLAVARRELARFGDRVSFVEADLAGRTLHGACEVVFSTATFHWIADHATLFGGLFQALRPGGRLHAQCGGEGNLAGFLALAGQIANRAPFAAHLAGFKYPAYFAPLAASGRRLRAAGFFDVECWLAPAKTPFATAEEFREFTSTIVLRDALAALPEELRDAFADEVVAASKASATPLTLDYVRLNLRARR